MNVHAICVNEYAYNLRSMTRYGTEHYAIKVRFTELSWLTIYQTDDTYKHIQICF